MHSITITNETKQKKYLRFIAFECIIRTQGDVNDCLGIKQTKGQVEILFLCIYLYIESV